MLRILNYLAIVFLVVLFSGSSRSLSAFGQAVPEMRTPLAPATPRINGPVVYGVRPGHPFLYRIPCTGTRPIVFSARNLPASLKLETKTGIISGNAPEKAQAYIVTLAASNSGGHD